MKEETERNSRQASSDAAGAGSGRRTRSRPARSRPFVPAKLARPHLSSQVYARERLFERLDRAFRDHALCWIEGLPGAGKTTLALSWLEARGRPILWYQVDPGDNELPTFFHYLGLAIRNAAPGFRRPLPHLTPEYLGGIETFARRFFEECARRLPEDTVIVFDNIQEAGQGPLSDLLGTTLDAFPYDLKVLCLSRLDAPPCFARLRANGHLAHLDREVLRLSLEEAEELAVLRGSDRQAAASIHSRTQGWTAGLVLMLEQQDTGQGSAGSAGDPQALFDYFAGEVLRGFDEPTRDVLLKSALLPQMHTTDLQRLTSHHVGAKVLDDLVRRNYFTYRVSRDNPLYEYHPLFRAFLLARLSEAHSFESLVALRRQAAALLEERGHVEAAAQLWHQAGDSAALGRLVRDNAERLVGEGRMRQLESWLRSLPDELVAADPWLEFWLGNCRLAYDPAQARAHLERAYELFRNEDDVAGQYLAWASVIDTFVYEWGDFSLLDRWVGELEHLRARHPQYPSPAIEARVVMGMVGAVTWRFPCHPDASDWAERAMRIVVTNAGTRLAMLVGNHLVFYHLWDGQFPKAAAVIEVLRPSAPKLDRDPLALLHWYVLEAMYSFCAADHPGCMAAIEAGNRLAADTGVRLLDIYLNSQGVYSAVSIGDRRTARECAQRMVEAQPTRPLDKSLYYYMLASVEWLEGDSRLAIEHGDAAVQLAEVTHSTIGLGLCEMELAVTLFDAGRRDEAATYLARARESSRGRRFMEFLDDMHNARFSLEMGNEAASVKHLRRALRVGAEQGYANIPRWQPASMSRLCALALEHDIEPAYVSKLIEQRGLSPPDGVLGPERWPWAVRIRSLGGFSVQVNGTPLEFSSKGPRRTLELLKVLISQGARGVATESVADMLWPDVEGDAAHRSLKITVHRLRKLLGTEQAIRVQGGQMSLNPEHCWVDAWVFEHLLSEAETAARAGVERSESIDDQLERLLAYYHGPFLGDEPFNGWAINFRERLHGRLLRLIEDIGVGHEQTGDLGRAILCYQLGVELDGTCEPLHRRLMLTYHAMGRTLEAQAVFENFREAVHEQLNHEPSQRMTAEYKAVKEQARSG